MPLQLSVVLKYIKSPVTQACLTYYVVRTTSTKFGLLWAK